MSPIISKTDFKIGSNCTKKLWYKKHGYPTANDENEYMQYLAKGGYIVAKMAQLIYSGGIDLSLINDPDLAVSKTKELISNNENIIIYEAAVYSNNKIARIDILEKIGNELRIIEVKAKSQSSDDEKEKIPKDYLNDVLFQVITTEEAYKGYDIKGFLFLPDKSKTNKIEGLAGWFIIEEDNKEVEELDELAARSTKFHLPKVRFKYEDDPQKDQMLAQLKKHSIMELRDIKHADFKGDWEPAKVVVKNIFNHLFTTINEGIKEQDYKITKNCKSCEYTHEQKSGYNECWHEWEEKDTTALNLYYGGSLKYDSDTAYLDHLINNQTLSLNNIAKEIILGKKKEEDLTARSIRQLMQIKSFRTGKEEVRLDVLKEELAALSYPIHFIDFETYTGAIPFHQNMRPYETIAFQWSCHTLTQDGKIEHTEWINFEESFPNFRFAEALMKVVEGNGTPLMWSHHENTVLRHILAQIEVQEYKNKPLKEWLIKMTSNKKPTREGRLVDMARICEKTYVHPDCKGKVSIKKILPVIWQNEVNADLHNHPLFKAYYKKNEWGQIMDPYKTLNPIEEFLEIATLEAEEVIDEGTAAMKAYFELIYGRGAGNEKKKKEIRQLLLQYCKLDTLAMVIIYQYWKKLIAQ